MSLHRLFQWLNTPTSNTGPGSPIIGESRVRILRAFRPGDVVVIECDQTLSASQLGSMRKMLDEYLGTDIKFVVLSKGMRVVAREELS